MEVMAREMGDAVVVDVSGKVDMWSSPDLRQHLLGAMKDWSRRLVINISDVSFIDSSGLATLIEAFQRIKRSKGRLFLVGPNRTVSGVLKLAHLDNLFEIRATLDEALK
jgi:anti-sigma B factor antagonist